MSGPTTGEAHRTAERGAAVEQLVRLFQSLGLRATRQRCLIAEQLVDLAAAREDFVTEELWRALQRTDPGIGRATVYRTVERLVQGGVLDRVTFADGSHRYRMCDAAHHHHHVTCSQCQRVVEVTTCLPPELLSAIADQTDFAIERHELELFGLCADCRDN